MNKLVAALFIALGCSQTVDAACSPESLEANVLMCKIALAEAKSKESYDAIEASCLAMISAWEKCDE